MSCLNDDQIELIANRILSVLGGDKAKSPLYKDFTIGVVLAIADELEELIIRSIAVSLADTFNREDDDDST
jgi:hypothetical protein